MAGSGLGVDAVLVQRSIQRIAVDAPMLSRRAASRALSPASTIETARALRSFEYPCAIACPQPLPSEQPNLICAPKEIPCTVPIHIKWKAL
jgi:hypothetical protein